MLLLWCRYQFTHCVGSAPNKRHTIEGFYGGARLKSSGTPTPQMTANSDSRSPAPWLLASPICPVYISIESMRLTFNPTAGESKMLRINQPGYVRMDAPFRSTQLT